MGWSSAVYVGLLAMGNPANRSWGEETTLHPLLTCLTILLLQDLAPIKPEDVGYDMSASYVGHRSSTGSRPQSGLTAGEVHHGNASGHNALHHGNVSRVSLNSDTGEVREDPLFNMLMTLQEAANTQSADFWSCGGKYIVNMQKLLLWVKYFLPEICRIVHRSTEHAQTWKFKYKSEYYWIRILLVCLIWQYLGCDFNNCNNFV